MTAKRPAHERPGDKWRLLILAALTCTFVVGVPASCLAVLFGEIMADLGLSLVQVGLLWSIGSLTGVLSNLASGVLIDRFGPKPVMLIGILLTALTAALRGLAGDFASLMAIILVVGAVVPLVTTSAFKIAGIRFTPQRLGVANGVLSMGMVLGFLLGSLLSATILSPGLGGWRNVMFLYGAVAILFCLPWAFARVVPSGSGAASDAPLAVPMRQALLRVVSLKNVWLLGLAFMGVGGCIQSLSGYLPLHLRSLGWPAAGADGALSLYNAVNMVLILPIALFSDRLRSRKNFVLVLILMICAGTAFLSFAGGAAVWAAVVLAGAARDGTTSQLIAMSIETEGVGPAYAGTATGFMMFLFSVGSLVAPPVGNRLATIHPGLPFAFWAGLAALGALMLAITRSPRADRTSGPRWSLPLRKQGRG